MINQKVKAAPWIESGNHFLSEEKWPEAVHCLYQSLKVDPDNADAYALIAQAYSQQNLPEQAQSSYQKAHELAPDNHNYLYNLALFFQKIGLLPQAEVYYLKLLSKQPEHTDAMANLGRLYQDTNRPELALHYYEQDIRLRPDDPDSHFNLAFIHLLTGNYEAGWREYEWRFQRSAAKRTYPHSYEQPRWNGEPFSGQTLLIHGEQGFGDNLQFLRYLPLVKKSGGRVLFEVPKLLAPLIKDYPGIDQLLNFNPSRATQASFDFFIPLLNLPGIFKTLPTTIPASEPHVTAPPQLCEKWQKHLASPRHKVGLVWGGHTLPDHLRSCSAKTFRPLCEIDGIDFYGLQTGEPAKESKILETTTGFRTNLGNELINFADTAAIISQLDLTITIDTATAHLAGAMGRPVWVLLPFAPDWRWFLSRSDSPWYPTMRLFRQSEAKNWQQPLDEIKEKLCNLTTS